jgi:lysophospholipase L1-like esterase
MASTASLFASTSGRSVGRLILLSLLAAQTIALIGAAFLVRQYYIQGLETKAAPANDQVYERANALLPAKSQWRVVLFGDSRVEQWSPLPHIDGVEIVNRGVDGETTAQMRLRFDADVLRLQPDVVVIQAGINDLVAASLSAHAGDRIRQGLRDNLRQLATLSAAAGARVVLLTIIPPASPSLPRRLVWNPDIVEDVEDVNAFIRSLDSLDGVIVVDAAGLLAPSGGELPADYAHDTLHFEPAAYATLNKAITMHLRR